MKSAEEIDEMERHEVSDVVEDEDDAGIRH